MVININKSTSYEVETAKKENGQIVAVRQDGSKIIIGGDLENIEVIGGEIVEDDTPEKPNETNDADMEARVKTLEDDSKDMKEALEMILSGVTE